MSGREINPHSEREKGFSWTKIYNRNMHKREGVFQNYQNFLRCNLDIVANFAAQVKYTYCILWQSGR